MPELPEVEVVKQSLEKYVVNKKLLKIIKETDLYKNHLNL